MEELVEIEAEIVHLTDNAVLVEVGETETWIPKSVIVDDLESASPGDQVTLEIAEWFAEKEGLC